MRRLLLAVVAGAAALSISTPAVATDDPVKALEHKAQPLRTTEPTGSLADLEPFGRMVGKAEVVGLGEATHSSHEFFTMKHRVFRYLVERKGFRRTTVTSRMSATTPSTTRGSRAPSCGTASATGTWQPFRHRTCRRHWERRTTW